MCLHNYQISRVLKVLLDLSKTFDQCSCDILIVKLNAYEFVNKTLNLIDSNKKNTKQCVLINKIYSTFLELICGAPQMLY